MADGVCGRTNTTDFYIAVFSPAVFHLHQHHHALCTDKNINNNFTFSWWKLGKLLLERSFGTKAEKQSDKSLGNPHCSTQTYPISYKAFKLGQSGLFIWMTTLYQTLRCSISLTQAQLAQLHSQNSATDNTRGSKQEKKPLNSFGGKNKRGS